MGIEILDSVPDEQLNYKEIFMDKLIVDQHKRKHTSEAPKYHVVIIYSKQAYGSDGAIYDDIKFGTRKIDMPDYMKEALIKAAANDPDLINALGAIQVAIANVIAEKHGLNVGIN